MERLQWWLLLLSAVMFSMSGCATLEDWQMWSAHPAHFASSNHLAFSVKSHPTAASITDVDTAAAAREEWWGRLMPEEKTTVVAASAPAPAPAVAVAREGWWRRLVPATKATVVAASAPAPAPTSALAQGETVDMTGVWRGRWVANGAWGERRESDAEVVFLQSGSTKGTGRMKLADTVAAVGVPEIVRNFGALGTPMNYRISRGEVFARYEDGPPVAVRFIRVGDRIYGRIDASPSFLLVLDRQ